jgi:peptide deformylase
MKPKKKPSSGNGSSDAKAYFTEVLDKVKNLKPPEPESLSEVHSVVREIVRFPDPRLKRKAIPVEAFDDDLRKLVADMAQTLYSETIGVGLSAPQVGDNRRVIIVDIFAHQPPDPKKRLPSSQLLVAVNPEVWPVPGNTSREIEGCLSLPGIYGHVTRSDRILLKAFSLRGELFAMSATRLLGRTILHEVDHLDGMTLLDRFDSLTRRVALKDLSKTKAPRPKSTVPTHRNLDSQ